MFKLSLQQKKRATANEFSFNPLYLLVGFALPMLVNDNASLYYLPMMVGISQGYISSLGAEIKNSEEKVGLLKAC